jgi:hypothetical protein
MSFLTRELSRILGRPITLYYFRWGSDATSYYAFTDGETAITAAGALDGSSPPTTVSYTPTPIERGTITSSGTLDKATLEVTVPRNNGLAELFIAYPPAQVVTCVIRQAHRGETDSWPAIWVGRVTSMRFEDSAAKFTLEPVATSLRRTGLRRNYQFGCPHALYGPQCRADKPAATVTVAVTSISNQTLVLPTGWFGSIPITKYLGGLAQWTTPDGNTEIRTILRKSGNDDLVLGGIIRGLSAAQNVELSLGCNHKMDDCADLHVEIDSGSPLQSNIHNFGGQPWIPLENPVGRSQRINVKLPRGSRN